MNAHIFHGILHEAPKVWLFILVTVLMGGWAAWRTGIALARTWKPAWMLIAYGLLIGIAVRFMHFALFQGTLLSMRYYIVDAIVVIGAAYIGWRHERANAMARQYAFAFEKTSFLTWRRKSV